jgi:hypothetical protein
VPPKDKKLQPILLIGDAMAIFAVIFVGLRFHETEGTLGSRLLVNFLSFLVAWLLAANTLDLLRPPKSTQWSGLWQLVLAAIFTAPLGAVLRGFALSRPILPIFVLVIFFALLIGLLTWRAIYITLVTPRLKSK